jgi:CRISPR-associated protein Csm4
VVYRLVARSPFHLGERGVGIEETTTFLRADTLFSALCLTLRELGYDLNGFLGRYPRVRMAEASASDLEIEQLPGEEPPPLRISSAFPFAGDVHLWPRPFLPPYGLRTFHDVRLPTQLGKTLKKVRFVSQTIFEHWLRGDSLLSFAAAPDPDDPSSNGPKRLKMRDECFLQGGQVWVTAAEAAKLAQSGITAGGELAIWRKQTASRVAVDRVTNRSQVYAAGRVHFAPRSGLAFLADYGDEAMQPIIEQALRMLGDSGVGGERSNGHGQFTLEIREAGWPASPAEANAFCTLAPYWPREDEVQAGVLDEAAYQLVVRRGWVASPDAGNLRRRGVRMLTEGSVFTRLPVGALADVKPLDPVEVPNAPHPIWRAGMAFPIPCLLRQENQDRSRPIQTGANQQMEQTWGGVS